MLRDLTELEQSLPIAAFMDRPVVEAGGIEPMDPADAILPDDLNIILDQAKVPAKSGYCMLPDGASYLTVKATLPNVTKEMIQWMIAWQGLAPVNYMAVNPKTHHSAAVSDIDREKIGLPFLSVEQKSEGIFIYSVDEIGGKLVDTITSYLSPMDQGLCMDCYAKADVLTIGGYTLRQDHEEANPAKKSLSILISTVRDTEGGVEVQTHAWGGYRILRRESKRFDVNGIQPTEEYTKMMADYIASEWAQIGNILPELYKAFSDEI